MRTVIGCLLVASLAVASPGRRLALVVGANRGDPGDQPLRFAEADAARMAHVLRELGGFAAGDVVELRTPDAAALQRAMDALAARADAEAKAGRPPLLLFYYSGHSDEASLHLAGGRVELTALRRWLAASPAAVRLAVLDSCRSGALTRVKGAHAAPPIEVRLSDDLNTRGEALLTSSTSDEQARESDGLRGSFFTHHLVTGLRGAADRSKDGRVTLAEAYDYAYAHTVAEAAGGQHPTFKYDLAGRGEVVLTSLGDAGAWLVFPAGSEGVYLIVGEDGLVLGDVEVGKTPLKVSVAPGRYEVRKRTAQGDFAATVTLGNGEERWVHDNELAAVPNYWQGPPKGEAPPQPPPYLGPPAAAVADTLEAERERARGERKTGLVLTGFGLGGLLPFAFMEASIQLKNDAGTTAWLAPLTAGALVASSALFSAGIAHAVYGKRDLEDLSAPVGDAFSRAHARAERRRTVGKLMLLTGLSGVAVGGVVGTVGAALGPLNNSSCLNDSQLYKPDCSSGGVTSGERVAMMAIGYATAAIGLGVALAGGGLWRDAHNLDERVGEGRLDFQLAPLVFRDGAGVGLAGSF